MLALRNDGGFSLIEVLIATLVLATGALGMAGLMTISAISTRDARVTTAESILAMDKLEQLGSLAWDFDQAGARVSDTTTDVGALSPTTGGLGLTSSPSDALDRNEPGYVDFLDDRGRWVGAGAAPPPTAAFVRRWQMTPMTTAPDTLVVQVLVSRAGRPRSVHDALVTTFRSRTVR